MKRSDIALKSILDTIGICVMLLVIPFMCLIALAIKIDSRGPVFFRQLRVGRHGQRFRMFKFRTMVPDADAMKDSLRHRNEAQEGLFKIADDPRITRVGRFLRCTSLDELPQLFNVMKGEMSLVGPRPLIVEEDRLIAGEGCQRSIVKPGMTGHWQILGPGRVSLQEMAIMDASYVCDWSIWKDIRILLLTVLHVVGRKGDMTTSKSRKAPMKLKAITTKQRQVAIAAIITGMLIAGTGGVLAAARGLPSSGSAAQAQYGTPPVVIPSSPPAVVPPAISRVKPHVPPKHKVHRAKKHKKHHTVKHHHIVRHKAAVTG